MACVVGKAFMRWRKFQLGDSEINDPNYTHKLELGVCFQKSL